MKQKKNLQTIARSRKECRLRSILESKLGRSWGETGGREPGRKLTGGGRGKSGRRESSEAGKQETTLIKG